MNKKASLPTRSLKFFLLVLGMLAILGSANIAFDLSLASLSNLTRWDEFNFVSWVTEALVERVGAASIGVERFLSDEQQTEIVLTYFHQAGLVGDLEARLQEQSADPSRSIAEEELRLLQEELRQESERMHRYARVAESIVQNQTERSLQKLGFGLGGQVLPPVLFKVSDLPLNLIISARDQIGTLKSYSLNPGMDPLEKDRLESQILNRYNLSALVEPVGGLGAYPTMVMRTMDLNWLTEVVAHEWIHNYLSFYPLGVRYFQNDQLRSMNETLANLAGKEIGRRTMLDYYPTFLNIYRLPGRGTITVLADGVPFAFNYRAEMRETRLVVDALLANGKILQAERYMEVRRQFFWEHGYRLRKINQAYFAFYGSYNDTPGGGAAGSDPIGPAVQTFRKSSPDLKSFVDGMKLLKSFEELQLLLE